MIEGGDFGGECSGRESQPSLASCGGKRSNNGTETAIAIGGWKDTESVLRALSCTVPGAFLQQSCEAGISICPQSCFIMRQHARSSIVISAFGAIHAIAGATNDTSSSNTAPSLRRGLTVRRIRRVPDRHNSLYLERHSPYREGYDSRGIRHKTRSLRSLPRTCIHLDDCSRPICNLRLCRGSPDPL